MIVTLFRCCKQLCGKTLVLNLSKSTSYFNTRFMSRAMSEHQDEHTSKVKQDSVGFSEKSKFVATEDFNVNKDTEYGEFSKYGISEDGIKKLKDAAINHLFAVQYDTYNHIHEGKDIIVQARTGTGKTLAFVLPIVENLRKLECEICLESGRPPVVLTLAPARELALQIYQEFKNFKSDKVNVSCFYGGLRTSYIQQVEDIDNGIDVLVGTPGRILDLIVKGKLDCSKVRHVVLDEVDRMMDMGFQEEINQILLNAYTEENRPQMLFFSATVPPWVNETVEKYTSADLKRYDFIGTAVKSAISVEHKALMCSYQNRAATIKGLIHIHNSGKHGKTIIFTRTKEEAKELAWSSVLNMNTQVLHGDIKQYHRELILDGFRTDKFNCLIATDVAARGLDIPKIDLVIQTEPPRDVNSYIHRAGRTGRAGNNGLSIILFKREQEGQLRAVEGKAGIQFTRIRAAQPQELLLSLASDAVRSLDDFKADFEHFIPYAKRLIESHGAEYVLASALALISGATETAPRSILSSQKGYTSYICQRDKGLRSTGPIWRILSENFNKSFTDSIHGMVMCKDRKGCVFDIPTEKVREIKENWKSNQNVTLKPLKYLPALVPSNQGGRNRNQYNDNRRDGPRPPARRNGHNSNQRKYFSHKNSNFNNGHNNSKSDDYE